MTRKSRSTVSVHKLLKKGCSAALIGVSSADYDYQGNLSLNNGSTVTVRLVLFLKDQSITGNQCFAMWQKRWHLEL